MTAAGIRGRRGALRLELADDRGQSRLQRQLRVEGGDCRARAEAIALIVYRFFAQLGGTGSESFALSPPPGRALPSSPPPASPPSARYRRRSRRRRPCDASPRDDIGAGIAPVAPGAAAPVARGRGRAVDAATRHRHECSRPSRRPEERRGRVQRPGPARASGAAAR